MRNCENAEENQGDTRAGGGERGKTVSDCSVSELTGPAGCGSGVIHLFFGGLSVDKVPSATN